MMTGQKPACTRQEPLAPQLAIYRFRVRLELGGKRHALPPYLGSTIRGVFAASFRQLVCVTRAPVCEGCLLSNRCSYPYIFETPAPRHLPISLQKRFRQAPRPYILDVPMAHGGVSTLEVGLVLVGKAIDFLPYFIFVLDEAGKRGIGRARVPYRLTVVTDGSMAEGGVVFRADERILRDDFHAVRLEDLQRTGDERVEQVTLEFLTPLRVKKYGEYQETGEKIEFSPLMDLLLGRIEALTVFHCGDEWAPSERLREKARSVQIVDRNLYLERLERYSNRKQQKLPMHGILGTITFAGELPEFLPLLRMGEYIHIGAGTAFGLGRYQLDTLS
jgi:hypothetical protein